MNGVVVKIEGNPDNPSGLGRLCPRGLAGIMTLYDPSRLNFPVKRTNPDKGIGVDPKWVRISWDEALDTIAERLRKIRENEVKGLLMQYSVVPLAGHQVAFGFAAAFGTPNIWQSGAGYHCGNAEHLFSGLIHASWYKQPDYEHCKYLMLFGVNAGVSTYYQLSTMAQRSAEARIGGMRLVVIDPMLNAAAEKADEWLPIRPGTDGALALGMINVLLNELELYDAEFLARHTNGSYLVKSDGRYLRNASGKPLIWDSTATEAKAFDDPTLMDPALLGEYKVQNVACRPAFAILKEHVKKYTPEATSKITTLGADTVRRIAREFGTAACIGSRTIMEGKELRYRPAAVIYMKGAQSHRHATLTAMAIELLNVVTGNCEAVGGTIGSNPLSLGYPGTGLPSWSPVVGPDGLLGPGPWLPMGRPYPPRDVSTPVSYNLSELFPLSIGLLGPAFTVTQPEKFKINYPIEMQISHGGNPLMSIADPQKVADVLKKIPFYVAFNIYLDESTEFADIVLPDSCYLERLGAPPTPMMFAHWGSPAGLAGGEWGYYSMLPAVEPLYERRNSIQVFLELAERVGMRGDMYAVINAMWLLKGAYRLDASQRYEWPDIVDRIYKCYFGPDHGLESIMKNGVIKWPKKVEEVYWKEIINGRVPIYFEYFFKVKDQVEKIVKELELDDFDLSDYQPVPDWRPCVSHEEKRPGYDLYAIYYRVPFHTFGYTFQNPWLDEVGELDPYAYYITVNADTAFKKGIREHDWIYVESAETGHRVKGRAKLAQGIHPEVVGIANLGGHWSKNLPVASRDGKGVCFNWLIPLELKKLDTSSCTPDLCVKVKVYRG